jgi:23S rRNA (cytosine1962-C5)-methyltransferase
VKTLTLTKSGLAKVRSHSRDLKAADIEESLRSLPPGEWCWLTHPANPKLYLSFINPLVEDKFVSVHIVKVSEHNQLIIEEFIESMIVKAFQYRQQFEGYHLGSRIFYGESDGLPGLIIDQFQNKAIIQINTAGIDRYRDHIAALVDRLIDGKSYFLDNAKYREKEYLPTYSNEEIPSLDIVENDLKYTLRKEVIQKVGFYYDHRENRKQLKNILQRVDRKFFKGLDLFSYIGAWGLNALSAGVDHVTFVDQGDFSSEINSALEVNGYAGRGSFNRADVFKFLDESIQQKNHFDLILCDPPAFAKSHLQKTQALDGYAKLHRKVLRLASPGAMIAFSSCTHYVTHEEFQKNILDAALKENKSLKLLYTGIQGWDHPVSSLSDRANYIKSYIYILE